MIINLIILILIVIIDQFTKNYLLSIIGLNNIREFIPGIIQFNLVQNTGGAFSIFRQYPIYFKIIGLVNVFLFSYLCFCSTVKFNKIIKTGCVFVLGGTIGNLIDRFIKGGVVDFLDFQFISFAVFNFADVFIDIGVVLILVGWIRKK